MKGKTRQNILGDLSAMWEALRHSRDGITNPWPLVRPEVNDSERGQPFTREQEHAILKAAKNAGNGWHLACLIARHTGLRYGSVSKLTWAEVDLDEGVLRHTPNKTKKHNIDVVVPLVKPLLKALQEARSADVLGHVFEYFLGEFALAEFADIRVVLRVCQGERAAGHHVEPLRARRTSGSSGMRPGTSRCCRVLRRV